MVTYNEELDILEDVLPVTEFQVDDKVYSGVHVPCFVDAIVREPNGTIKWITFRYPHGMYKTLSLHEARNYYKERKE